MTCQLSRELIDAAVRFHGHSCPGLAIGIRASEYALREFGDHIEDLVCISETDMCGIDGIQYLTPCTLGKGNLIHLDYGKAAFSFFNRAGGKAVRLVLRPDAKLGPAGDQPADRQEAIANLMSKPLEQVFLHQPLKTTPPRPARVLASLVCEECGEETMESRTRRFAGRMLCIPCFAEVEQKR